MGLHFEGIQNGSNSHIYNTTSLQHNTTFTGGTVIEALKCKKAFIDNLIIENIYGNGINGNNENGQLCHLFKDDSVIVN